MGDITKFTKTQYEIIAEIAGIFAKAGFGMEPMCTLNSWGDTLEDETILDMLKGFSERMHETTNTMWRSVKKELPDPGERVLAFFPWGTCAVCWIGGNGNKWENIVHISEPPTHWQPLPPPPKE